jgi:hypothetical protein
VPHIRGFPLLGWQLARAESTSRPALGAVQSGQSVLCVVEECWRRHGGRFTEFVTQESLARDAETEQSETDEMLKGWQRVSRPRCVAQHSKII